MMKARWKVVGGLGEFHVHLALTPETHATFQRNKMNTFLLLFWIAVRMRKEYICKNPTFLGRKVQGCLPSLPPACLGVQIFCTLWPWAAETGVEWVREREREAIKGQRGKEEGGKDECILHLVAPGQRCEKGRERWRRRRGPP